MHEEEALGKAYDSRLMKRLLTYLRPYKWQVAIALVTIVLKASADVLGPLLTIIAVDKYLAPKGSGHYLLDRWLSPSPLIGIAQIGALYVFLLCFSFFLEFAQTYYMQWTGQKVMFDLCSQIFRHLQQMHVGFFDKNPVGRLVTRVDPLGHSENYYYDSRGVLRRIDATPPPDKVFAAILETLAELPEATAPPDPDATLISGPWPKLADGILHVTAVVSLALPARERQIAPDLTDTELDDMAAALPQRRIIWLTPSTSRRAIADTSSSGTPICGLAL